jgi:hypothetical protein
MVRAVRDTLEDNPGYFGRLVVPLPERVRPRKRGGRGMRWRRSLEPPLRLKEIYFREGGFPETRLYKEWKLFVDADRLAVLAEKEPDVFDPVGEMILECTYNNSSACRVLWLSDAHVLLCSDENTCTNHNPFPFLPPYLWRCYIRKPMATYELSLHALVADDDRTPQVFRALNRILALGCSIFDAYLAYAPGLPPYGIEDFVSRTRSKLLTVHLLMVSVDPETARAVVRNCNGNVALQVSAGRWQDHGAALAEAMADGQFPQKLALDDLDEESIRVLAPALQAARGLDELTINIQDHIPDFYRPLFDAIGRSGGIRYLIMMVTDATNPERCDYWEPILSSTSIRRLYVRDSLWALFSLLIDSELPLPRQEAERVVQLIRSNRALLEIHCFPRIVDRDTTDSLVVPVLRANRARRSIKAVLDGAGDGGASSCPPRRAASRLLASPLVRDHPEALFLVIHALFGAGELPPSASCVASVADE